MSVIPSDIRFYAAYGEPMYDGSTTLNGDITSGATSLVVTSPASFPPTAEYLILIDSEIILVTQVSGSTYTLLRAQCGTVAAAHNGSSSPATVSTLAGGPVNPNGKIGLAQLSGNDKIDVVSSSTSDTLVKVRTDGRDGTGVLVNEVTTANGTTVVNGTQTFGRGLRCALASVTTLNGAISNSATSIAVTSGAALPSSGTIRIGLEQITYTSNSANTLGSCTRGVNGTTGVAHNSLDPVYLIPVGDVAAIQHTATVTGTAQAVANPTGSTPALLTLAVGQGASVSVGQVVRITGGSAGVGQLSTIVATNYGGNADQVALSRAYTVLPTGTITYSVNNGFLLDLLPNQIHVAYSILANGFANASGGAAVTFYEKFYVQNDNTTTSLVAQSSQAGVTVSVTPSPSLPGGAVLTLAAATVANDSQAWAGRTTAPSAGFGSFGASPATLTANGGNLAPGAAPNAANAQSIVAKVAVAAGTSPYNGSITQQASGATT